MITLIQLKTIFLELAEIFSSHVKETINALKSKNKINIDPNTENETLSIVNPLSDVHLNNLFKIQDIINFDLFLDSLAISACFVKYSDQYTHCEKVLIFKKLDFTSL